MEPTIVKIGLGPEARQFEVKPLVNVRYKQLFGMVGEMISELVESETSGEGGLDLDDLAGSIPALIEALGDRRIKLYAYCLVPDEVFYDFAVNKPKPRLEVDKAISDMVMFLDFSLTMSQECELLAAIIEQNDIEGLVKNFKKMAARAKIGAKFASLGRRSGKRTSSSNSGDTSE